MTARILPSTALTARLPARASRTSSCPDFTLLTSTGALHRRPYLKLPFKLRPKSRRIGFLTDTRIRHGKTGGEKGVVAIVRRSLCVLFKRKNIRKPGDVENLHNPFSDAEELHAALCAYCLLRFEQHAKTCGGDVRQICQVEYKL